MPIVLDETTRAAYLAQSLASSRASLVVSALTAPVTVEVRDGNDGLRALGTMAAPWATSSGSTITVGQVTGAGISVTSGGVPDANWYCQFRGANGRFVRGTFGLAASGADFQWSLSSFATGSRGTLAAVSLSTQGAPEIVVDPVVFGSAQVGQTLSTTTGSWTGFPTSYSYGWQRSASGTSAWSDVAGAAGASYVQQQADLAQFLRSFVVASNSSGSSSRAFGTVAGPVAAAGALPLVQSSDMRYLGAFRLPFTGDPSYAFGGQALAFNPGGNGGAGSLFMVARTGGSIGEITIPELVDVTGTNSITALRQAQHIQFPSTSGFLQFTNSHISAERKLKGLLVHSGQLIAACDADYPSAGIPPTATHLKMPLNLATTNQYQGPYKVAGTGDWNANSNDYDYSLGRLWSGYMCHVPAEWQGQLGGPCITGNVGDSIVAQASDGPSALAFDPSQLSAGPVSGQKLLCYPPGFPLYDTLANAGTGQFNTPWNWASIVSGACIPNGTRSILFIGTHGVGELIYGTPTTDWTLHNTPNGTTGFNFVYDPAQPTGNGEHAYPYRYSVWAYDLNDLAAVKAGTKTPHELRPYQRWEFTLPFEGSRERLTPDPNPDSHHIGGCAYDPATRRLYVTQGMGGFGARDVAGFPIIHVFEIASAVPA